MSSCGAPFIPGSTAISATGDEGGTTVGAGVASAGTVIGDGPRSGVVISVEFATPGGVLP